MRRATEFWILVGIIIIASFFRLYHITTTPPGLYPDEAMDGNSASQAALTGHYKVFYTEDNGREGLYVNLVASVIGLVGPEKPWAVRFPAVVAGILTVLGMYYLGKELFSARIGLLASFFTAVSFWHVNFSRIGFRAILAPFFLTWALFLLIRAFRRSERTAAIWYALAAGVLYGLGFYTYIAYRITPLLLLLFIPYFWKQKGFWRVAVIFLAATFLVALPIGLYFLHNPADFFGRTSQISIFSSQSPLATFAANVLKTLAMFNFRGDGNERHNYMGQPELEFGTGILFAIGIVFLAAHLISRKKRDRDEKRNTLGYLLLAGWFALGILPVAISNDGIPHALRAILLIPPAMFFAAIGAIWLYETLVARMNRKVVNALAAIFLAYLAGFGYYKYFVLWANDPSTAASFNADYVAIGDAVNALPAETPKYVIVQAGGVPVPIDMPDGTVKNIPTPAMTTMYITNTYTAKGQAAKHVTYLLPDEVFATPLPAGAQVFLIK